MKKKYKHMPERFTYLLLPGGEWQNAILTAFLAAGLEWKSSSPRSYEYRCLAIPIIMVLIRTKDVPVTIYDEDSIAKGGLTGSDVAEDQGIKSSWAFPLYELEKPGDRFPKPKVYLGVTPNLPSATPNLRDLEGSTIYTAYPGITIRFLAEEGVKAEIKTRQGKIEGMWRIDPANKAIVDISNSGATGEANQIRQIQTIMEPKVVFVQSPLINRQDQERINDLREKINLAVIKKKCYDK